MMQSDVGIPHSRSSRGMGSAPAGSSMDPVSGSIEYQPTPSIQSRSRPSVRQSFAWNGFSGSGVHSRIGASDGSGGGSVGPIETASGSVPPSRRYARGTSDRTANPATAPSYGPGPTVRRLLSSWRGYPDTP